MELVIFNGSFLGSGGNDPLAVVVLFHKINLLSNVIMLFQIFGHRMKVIRLFQLRQCVLFSVEDIFATIHWSTRLAAKRVMILSQTMSGLCSSWDI